MDKILKVCNLFAGIGGNRRLWEDVEVTAVELNPQIAAIYQDFFPDDKVIVGDAHQYLLDHYKEFDFIWSSPPCQSHSQVRYNLGFLADRIYKKVEAIYPDMTLYQEIILLQKYFSGDWVIENTISYYKPLIPPQEIAGHYLWSNLHFTDYKAENRNHRGGTVETLQERKLFDLSGHDIQNKRQILRNCVEPELGEFVLNTVRNSFPQPNEGLFAL